MDNKLLQILTLSAFTLIGIGHTNARQLDERDAAFHRCVTENRNCDAFQPWGDYAVDVLCGTRQGKDGCDKVCSNWGREPGREPTGTPPTFRCDIRHH